MKLSEQTKSSGNPECYKSKIDRHEYVSDVAGNCNGLGCNSNCQDSMLNVKSKSITHIIANYRLTKAMDFYYPHAKWTVRYNLKQKDASWRRHIKAEINSENWNLWNPRFELSVRCNSNPHLHDFSWKVKAQGWTDFAARLAVAIFQGVCMDL